MCMKFYMYVDTYKGKCVQMIIINKCKYELALCLTSVYGSISYSPFYFFRSMVSIQHVDSRYVTSKKSMLWRFD